MFNKEFKEIQKTHITVGFFYESGKELFKLKSLNGEVGFDRKITDKNIHRPGLRLLVMSSYLHTIEFKCLEIQK